MTASRRVRRHWLVKSEPDVFSFDDLLASPRRTTSWDGVRNYQARNFIRDEMKVGDPVFFYHSSSEPTAIVGVAEVSKAAYPDPTALDPSDDHYDPKSRADTPTWYAVELRAVAPFARPVTLTELREVPALQGMTLLQKGSRLSIQPVSSEEWRVIYNLGIRPRRS